MKKTSVWHRRVGGAGLSIAVACGVLIWMKLRLVTGLPRSVYAEPIVMPTIPHDTPVERTYRVDSADRGWREGQGDAGSRRPSEEMWR
jgi:hypothetical protein